VSRFSNDIDNGPVLFSLLKMREVQINRFVPPQAAG
jgi:hypothetical protein